MQTKAKILWSAIVDAASPDDQLRFIEGVVNDVAEVFQKNGKLPGSRDVRITMDPAFIAFTVYPIGDIGNNLVTLGQLLVDPKHRGSFHVSTANAVNVLIEDVQAGREGGAKPGLLLSANGYPALLLGGDPDRLSLQMEGFDRALIGLSADVPELWDNVSREQGPLGGETADTSNFIGPRKHRAMQMLGNAKRAAALWKRQFRSSAAGILRLVLPAVTIRPVMVSHGAAANLGGGGLLVPIRGKKFGPGAFPPRPPVKTLREALGVQCVIAKICLHELLGDESRAIELVQAGLPGTYGHFRDIGMEHYSSWTGFDDERHLATWAQFQYAHVQRTRRQDGMAHHIDAALEPVQRLAIALNHAQFVASAHDEAETVDVIKAAEILDEAYRASHHADLGFAALWNIARYGNIQPATLWSVDDTDQVETLEAVRVLGRVQAGAEGLMSPAVMRVIWQGLDAVIVHPDHNDSLAALNRHVAAELAQLLGRVELKRMLSKVEDTSDSVLIERQSRKMKVIPAKKALKKVFWLKKWLKWPF
jgi:hypothetical protein